MKRPGLTLALVLIQVLAAVVLVIGGGLAQQLERPAIRIAGLAFLPGQGGTRVQVRFAVTETRDFFLIRQRLDARTTVPWKGNHVHIGIAGSGFRVSGTSVLDLAAQFFNTHYRGSDLDGDRDPFTFIIQEDQEADASGQAISPVYLLSADGQRRGRDALLQSGETYTVQLWLTNAAHTQVDLAADQQDGQPALGLEDNPGASTAITFTVP